MKEPLVMYYSPKKIIGILMILAAAGALFIWMDTLFTYLLSAIIWIAFLSWLIKLLNRKPRVIVSKDGILDHRTRFDLIPWEDIDSIQISKKLDWISFYFTDPEKYLNKFNVFERLIRKPDETLGYGNLTVRYVGLKGNASDIANFIVELKSIGIIKDSDQNRNKGI